MNLAACIITKTRQIPDKTNLLAMMSCVVSMLWFAAQPVERAWCQTDVTLTYALPVLALAGVTLVVIKNVRPTLSRLDIALFMWCLYVTGRAYCEASYPCAAFYLRLMQMMMLYVAFRLLFASVHVKEEYIVVALVLYGLWEAWLGLSQFIQGSSRHHLYLLTGSFLNPGPYSAILAMGLAMALCRKKAHSEQSLYFPIVVFAVLLPATWSRAALLATAVCLGIIYWDEWKRWLWWVAASAIVSGIVLYYIKAGSANGRLIIYLISILNIVHHPILGSGIGSFLHQYAEGLAQFSMRHPGFNYQSADVLDYAFNDLLRIGVEQGLVGIGFALAVIIFTFRSLGNKGKVLRMGLLTLLIFSLFSYPFELLPYQLVTTIILGYAGTNQTASVPREWKQQLIHSFAFPVFGLSLIALTSLFAIHQIEQRAEAESEYRMMAGIKDVAFLDDYYELFPLLTENPNFLFDFGKMLAGQGRFNDSNAVLRRGTLVSNDPMFYVIQGNNYRDMEAYDEAETAYLKAYHILPNRLYPLYRLMCLYEQTGENKKMRQMAGQVVNFKVKVASPATTEMKDEARQLLLRRQH